MREQIDVVGAGRHHSWRGGLVVVVLIAIMPLAAIPLVSGCGDELPVEPEVREVLPETAFETVGDEAWDETAVRQVLHVFAFGGFASDAQIRAWADMAPELAIVEMLTFEQLNFQLSPATLTTTTATLAGMGEFWSSSNAGNPVPDLARERFDIASWDMPSNTFLIATSRTGANPVRQRIGLLETNYHMVANQAAGVNNWQMVRYYDDVMNGLAARLPYEQVVAIAAKSAAVATQYNHRENRFVDARFQGNEDFGREFHQLFFGILGEADPEYHELTTIRNTAKMLTDMDVARIEETVDVAAHDADVVTFGTADHYPGALEILGQEVTGSTAASMIDVAASIAVAHEESRQNLPVILIQYLADDFLDETETAAIQAGWASLESRDLLNFLRAYAISTTFHSTTRLKHWSSIERNIITSNVMTLGRAELLNGIYSPASQMRREGVALFRPLRNVFGGQTGLDAIASGTVFREAYNQSVERYWNYGRVVEEDDNGNVIWRRDWALVVPRGADGSYRVQAVAEWLWQRFIADGLAHFGPLERAHVYALLGAGVDFGLFVDEDDPLAVYTLEDLSTRGDLQELVTDMEIARMNIDSGDTEERQAANTRIGMAVNFIIATPYAFIQEGR